MGYKNPYGATNIVSSYIDSVRQIKHVVKENFEEMDLENASLKQDIEEVIDEINNKCDTLISRINEYSFE
ncbi:MAG: hypothetical protein R3Y54_10670 [Eubacteriales bacterium]